MLHPGRTLWSSLLVAISILGLDILLARAVVGADSSRADVRAAIERVYDANEYQTEMPRSQREPAADSAALDWLAELLSVSSVRDVIWLCLMIGAAITLVLITVFLLRNFGPVRRVPAVEKTAPAEIEVSSRPLGDAETYARSERYDEAIHVLLLRTLEELRRQLSYDPPDSLTSREILASAPLSTAARRELGALVHRVETHYFGARPAARADYDECVACFQRARIALAKRAGS